MADLAKLVVRLEAQSAQLLTELEKTNNRIDRFASKTRKTLGNWAGAVAGFFSARALVNFAGDILNAQAKLGDMAQTAGTSVEQLSRLGYAASQSGSDLDVLQRGLGDLAKTAVAAAAGSKSQADAFRVVGVEAKRADGALKSTDDLLLEIAESFSRHADGAEKSALAQQLFGKSGRELIPLLNKGAEGIEELTARADALGITVSTQAAESADQLNNSLATLGAVARGVVGKALADVTPMFANFAESQISAAEGSDRLDDSARVLASGMRLLASAGVIVGEIFDRVGSALGAVAAAVVAAAQGEFGEAWDILKDGVADFKESTEQAADDLHKIWEDTGAAAVKAAEDTNKALENLSNRAVFAIPSARPEKTEDIEKYYQKLQELTETDRERALRSIDEQLAALNKLADARRITDEQYRERLMVINEARESALGITQRELEAEERKQALFEEGRSVFEATRTPLEEYEQRLIRLNILLQQGAISTDTYGRAVENAQDELDKANGKMTDFAEQMRRNTQDILGEGLADAFKGSADDILDTFFNMINQMVAQALAADIAGKLFGETGGGRGGGGVGGIIGKGLDLLGGFFGFGGSRDSGGRGQPGMAYAIGRGAQPEVYVPDQPGTFYPRGEGIGGAGGMTQNIYVTGRVDQRSARQLELQAARRQRVANARLG